MKIMRKTTASLLIAALLFCGLVGTQEISTSALAPRTNMFYGMDAISKNLLQSDKIYYGSKIASGYTGKQLWRVGNPKGSNTGASGAMFLISEYTWRGPSDSIVFNADISKTGAQTWEGSDAQAWCRSFYNANFTTEEKNRMIGYNQTDPAGQYWYQEVKASSITASDKVFFMSADEFWRYMGRQRNYGSDVKATDINGNITAYWLRSPAQRSNNQVANCESASGSLCVTLANATSISVGVNGKPAVTMPYAARPAFNLKTDDLLFVSAVGAKSEAVGGMKSVGTDGDEFKLTFKDASRRLSIGTVTNDGSNVRVAYSGATTGSNSYVSAIIANNGKVKYYGKLARNSSSGTVAVPYSLIGSGDKLYLFSEAYNGYTAVDYASAPEEIAIPDPPQPSPTPSPSDGGNAGSGSVATAVSSDLEWTGTPASVPAAKSVKAKAGKGRVTVSWKKASKKNLKKFDKVEVQICTDKSFDRSNTIRKTVKKTKRSKAIKKLARKKTYYVRVRDVKGSGSAKLVSKWSKVKKVKIK